MERSKNLVNNFFKLYIVDDRAEYSYRKINSDASPSSRIIPGWDAVPLKTRLEDAPETAVLVENDANTGALAEWTSIFNIL